MPKVSVTKIFTFEAAHLLPRHNGKCANLHGHSYKVEITISGPINHDSDASSHGMVVDFGELSHVWKVMWENKLDHKLLNDLHEIGELPPTAESIALALYRYFNGWAATSDLVCDKVRVWETESGFAEVTP